MPPNINDLSSCRVKQKAGLLELDPENETVGYLPTESAAGAGAGIFQQPVLEGQLGHYSLNALASRRSSLNSSEVAARAVSPARRFLPASRARSSQLRFNVKQYPLP